jgi:NAD(P)-dependent dehydrogenase (short-subunit alcohol dehydrogenase family)
MSIAHSVIKGIAGKVAIITGANSGIGLATVQRFLKDGAKVVAFDINVDKVSTLTHTVQGDVANMKDLDRLYAEVKAKYNKVDVVFANAGICRVCPIQYVTEAHFDQIYNVNVKGLYFTVQKALPMMGEGGSIILTSSIGGNKGLAGLGVYCSTKAAVRNLARSMAEDLKLQKIRTNVISPGVIETPIFNTLGLTAEQSKQMVESFRSLIPAGRSGQPEEIASVAAFLASSESSYMNGAEVVADGGWTQV